MRKEQVQLEKNIYNIISSVPCFLKQIGTQQRVNTQALCYADEQYNIFCTCNHWFQILDKLDLSRYRAGVIRSPI